MSHRKWRETKQNQVRPSNQLADAWFPSISCATSQLATQYTIHMYIFLARRTNLKVNEVLDLHLQIKRDCSSNLSPWSPPCNLSSLPHHRSTTPPATTRTSSWSRAACSRCRRTTRWSRKTRIRKGPETQILDCTLPSTDVTNTYCYAMLKTSQVNQ